MSGTATETYRTALDIALTELVILITEARNCLYNEELPLACVGTLLSCDEKIDDVKAALRLYTNALRIAGRPQ